ncbi:MAG: RIP metalloprotease RseP [Sphingomonadales bacterium]|nr:RIP metalloprotease RseP [Sphingomonadales bacterium]
MDVLIMIAQMLLGLTLLILLHEWGHFGAARMFGIRVEKFYVFFDAWGKKFFSVQKGDTEYGLGWLPLGGYVKISGMIDESLDTAAMKSEPQSWEFRSKPAWQRLIVMIGGVTVNAILGILIFSGIFWYYGQEYLPNSALTNGVAAGPLAREIGFQSGDQIVSLNGIGVERFGEVMDLDVFFGENNQIQVMRNSSLVTVDLPSNMVGRLLDADNGSSFLAPRYRFRLGEIVVGMPANAAGLKSGDSILSIDGEPILFFDQLQESLKARASKMVPIRWMREGRPMESNLKVSEQGTIGIYPELEKLQTARQEFSLTQSIPAGAWLAWSSITDNLRGFGKVFSGEIPVEKSLGGPIAIAKKMYGGEWIWYRFWMTTALLSIILAFMNLLPIPALDGGHVLFLLIEMVIRRPVPEKVLIGAQYVGMAIVLLLMMFAFGNDIWQHVLN